MSDKKIIFLVDYTLEEYNSVRDILYSVLTDSAMQKYRNVIVKSDGNSYNPVDVYNSYGYKTYSFPSKSEIKLSRILKNKNYPFSEKVRCIFRRIVLNVKRRITGKHENYALEAENYLKKIVKKEKPDLIVFMDYLPVKFHTDICLKYKIPYVSMLYDTFIERPGIDIESALSLEKYVIENSEGYFVPNFFHKGYLKHYDNSNIIKYKLPLLVEKNSVLQAYKNTKAEYDFSYFGQIQSFRNGDKIKDIFRELEISLDIFTTEKKQSDNVFTVHPAITKDELYSVVAGSKYLVAFDNGAPYNDYLPSKAYLYVSFTKPVIAFGDNDSSALKSFFSDYPYFYYQNINDSVDGLKEFLNNTCYSSFNESVYNKYFEYLPENALSSFVNCIEDILG